MKKLLCILSLVFACFTSFGQSTGQVTLAWDASTDTRVTAYKLYYSAVSGTFDPNTFVLVPTVPPATSPPTQVTVPGLPNGKTVYFVVTALDQQDNLESIFSNEVSALIPLLPVAQITGLHIISVVPK